MEREICPSRLPVREPLVVICSLVTVVVPVSLLRCSGRLHAVGWIRVLHVAIRRNAFIMAVASFAALELVNVLTD
jgi:hypothetical protein